MNLIIAIIGFVLVDLYLNPFEGLPKGSKQLHGWLRVAYPKKTTFYMAFSGYGYTSGFV